MKIRKNNEDSEFWKQAVRASDDVKQRPAWKRGDLALSNAQGKSSSERVRATATSQSSPKQD